MVEHDPVVTLGRHANASNLLMPEKPWRQWGWKCIELSVAAT